MKIHGQSLSVLHGFEIQACCRVLSLSKMKNEHTKRPGSVNSQSTWQTQMENLFGRMYPQSFERILTDKAPLKIKITILDYETFEE